MARRGGPALPPFRSGAYVTQGGLWWTTAAPTQSRLRVSPFDNPRGARFDRIASDVTTVAAGSTLRWVIYADNGSNYPGALILDTGAVGDSATTTGAKEATINVALGARRYWLGCVAQGGNPTLRVAQDSSSHGVGAPTLGSTNSANLGFFINSVTGAAPAPFTAGAASTTQAPIVWLRKS